MATALAKVPPPGETLGLGRRETIYDTDVHPDGVPVDSLELFVNFQAWGNSGFTTTKKTKGRDTNLRGVSSFLPTGYKFGAYRWRMRPHSLDDDPCTLATIVHFSEVRLLRQLSYCVIKQDQNPYITAQTNDLVSWADNEMVEAIVTQEITATTTAAAIFIPTPRTDHEGRVLDVNGQPFVLSALENWSGEVNVPVARSGTPNFEPTIPIYDTMAFDGVLIRPSN